MSKLKMYRPGGTWSSTPTRGVVAQADADGGAQGYSRGSETDDKAEVISSDDLDVMGPYGFSFIPAKDTEYIEMDSSAGPAAVAFRTACPITIAQGESAHWFDEDVYAHAKSGEYIVEAATVKLGKNATEAVALDGDDVEPIEAFRLWLNSALATAAGGAVPPEWPTVPAVTAIGTVTASATKAKAE